MSRLFKPEEDKFLKKNYARIPTSHIGKLLKRTGSTVRQRLKLLGLQVPADKLMEFKNLSRFQKGRISENKGKKQEEFVSAQTIEKLKKTWYKKGHAPHNQREADGAITIRTYRKVKYYFVRVRLGVWIPLHRQIWEKHNGPLPASTKVVFKDGNTFNCDLQNLELLSNAELMKRNSIQNMPEDLKDIITVGRILNNQIKRTLKNLKNAK